MTSVTPLLVAGLASTLLLMRGEIGPLLAHRPIVLGPLLGASVGMAEAGFLLGALFEWLWIDRIPAGGLRTPAVCVGVAAAVVGLVGLREAGVPHRPGGGPLGDQMFVAICLAGLYTFVYVPVDGTLRRVWNRPIEAAIGSLDGGRVGGLVALGPAALGLRWLVVAVLLTSAASVATTLHGAIATQGLLDRVAALPWALTLPAAIVALGLRTMRPWRWSWLWVPLAFTCGWTAACFL